jgi:hypothetical protein
MCSGLGLPNCRNSGTEFRAHPRHLPTFGVSLAAVIPSVLCDYGTTWRHPQCRTMGNFVLPKMFSPLPTQLFAKNSIIHEHSRRAVEYYSNFGVRTGPRKTPPFLPPRGGSLFLVLPKKRLVALLAGAEHAEGHLTISLHLDSSDDIQHG